MAYLFSELIKVKIMVRSLWKGPFVDNFLIKKIGKTATLLPKLPVVQVSKLGNKVADLGNKVASLGSREVIKIWSRRSFILPEFINKFFEVYNGKQFISLQVNEEMVGHKFGEFASTRKKTLHKKKVKGKER